MFTASLKPITKSVRVYDLLALDSEGSGREGDFHLAVLYGAQGAQIFSSREQLKNHLFHRRNVGKIILAANLEYDYATCFQPFGSDYAITLVNRRWVQALRRDGSGHAWTAWDIQRIAPLSVADMGRAIGLPKLATPPELLDDAAYKPPEWSCPLHHRLYCVECYCVRDAEIVYKFALMYQQKLNDLGGELRMTVASCAMDLFRRKFLADEIAATWPERNALARACYHGGRVEVYHAGTSRDVNVYDYNSIYPAVMRECRVGNPADMRRVDAPSCPSRYMDNIGQFFGTLRLPDGLNGLLPYRLNERLYFPTGIVSGSWTLDETRHALERGAVMLECKAVIYARSTLGLFRQWVDVLYALRQHDRREGNPAEIVDKLLLNSLYGKFGQRTESGLQTLLIPPKKYRLETYSQDEPVLLAGGEAFLRTVETHVQSGHVQVAWAAQITSLARIRLYTALETQGESLAYCDTDSVHTSGVMPVSDELGGLKLEKEYARVTYFGAKEYGGITVGGEAVHRAKGIPPSQRERYLTTGTAQFRQPTHTLTAIRRGGRIAEWVNIEKQRHATQGNRAHAPLNDYNQPYMQTFAYDAGFLGGMG